MTICFATNNEHKLREVRSMLGEAFTILSLQDIGCFEELPEDHDTLEYNSRQKAEHVWQHYRHSCFADDTGLEVEALHNSPGVYSARYAGPQRSAADNMALLLQNLAGEPNRQARFRTSITLILQGEVHQFDGIVKGYITESPAGEGGFGYDPVFVPESHQQTFAQMPADEKNAVSHRGRAVQKLVSFLQKQVEPRNR
jgi:XTP/dITP diphosphohydrolase